MRGQDGEEIVALIPIDTDLRDVVKVLRALARSFKGARVRHSGTYLPRNGMPNGVMEVFRPAAKGVDE